MNFHIRLKSKYLLSKNTFRLFLISLLSFLLRWGSILSSFLYLYSFLNSGFLKALLQNYNNIVVYSSTFSVFGVILFFSVVFSSAVRLSEQFIYFTRAQGSNGNFRLFFKYLHPVKAFRAFRLYMAVNFYKLLWFVYFLLPVILCIGCTVYLYNISYVSQAVYITLSIGISLLLSLSLVMWRASVARYSAADYYICLNPSLKVSKAIKKSIRFTDGFLTDRILLEYSFFGWILSCVLVIPLFYVVPYVKLCKCVYITEMLTKKAHSHQSQFAVNHLKMAQSSQHIN